MVRRLFWQFIKTPSNAGRLDFDTASETVLMTSASKDLSQENFMETLLSKFANGRFFTAIPVPRVWKILPNERIDKYNK